MNSEIPKKYEASKGPKRGASTGEGMERYVPFQMGASDQSERFEAAGETIVAFRNVGKDGEVFKSDDYERRLAEGVALIKGDSPCRVINMSIRASDIEKGTEVVAKDQRNMTMIKEFTPMDSEELAAKGYEKMPVEFEIAKDAMPEGSSQMQIELYVLSHLMVYLGTHVRSDLHREMWATKIDEEVSAGRSLSEDASATESAIVSDLEVRQKADGSYVLKANVYAKSEVV